LNAKKRPDPGLYETIGKVLRYGVILSSAVLVCGLVLFLVARPPGTPSTLQGLVVVNFGRPTLDPQALLSGIAEGDAVSVLQLGTLVLIATPLARVAISIVLFLRERDMLYVGITALVLAMLLVAIFVIGPVEA
jgi:uncharacterized membrane protein